MKHLLLSLFLLLSVSVFAQEQKLEIRNLKGLNNIDGDFVVQPNQSRFDFNIDHGSPGTIQKRLGYDSVSTVSGMDSIVAIYGAYYSDGTQQLFVVCDLKDNGYGSVYVTPKGSSNLDSLTRIHQYWSVFGYPSFAMFGDDVYIVNGYSRGIVYSDGVTRDYPPKAPGEPTIVPLDDAGGLNGEYRYVFYVGDTTSANYGYILDSTVTNYSFYCSKGVTYPDNSYCNQWEPLIPYEADADSVYSVIVVDSIVDSTSRSFYQSVVSDKIVVKNGQVLLTGFQFPNTDSAFTTYPNGVRITIARTTGNPGRLTPDVKIYYVTDFLVPNADSAKKYIYIDSLSDNEISTGTNDFDVAIDINRDGRDSTGAISYRYGSPRFISEGSNVHYSDTTDTTNAFGIYNGMLEQRDTLGYAYTVTFIDTVTGIESDTGRTLFIWLDTSERSGDKPYSNTISLPRLTSNEDGTVLNLYRSPIKQITYDSSYWEEGEVVGGNGLIRRVSKYDQNGNERQVKVIDGIPYAYVYNLTPDTIVANDFYLIAQLVSSDSLYTDSLRQDSVSTKRRYSKSTPPDLLDNIFTYDGRLYGVKGSKLYRSGLLNSLVDTLQTWGQMDFQTFNESDGDIGTIAYPTRTSIRYFKNFSNFNVYDDFGKTELSGTIGCIAPQSHIAGISGHYYLSDAGVVYETEGQQLERTFQTALVSEKINNFDKLDISTKANAKAFYEGRKAMFCIGDSTYVYDERGGDWSVWDLTFGTATKYGTESNVNFIPGDTMYFVKSGDSVLYRYGSSETDNGTTIQVGWQTPPLFIDNSYKQITALGMWSKSEDTNDSLVVQVYNEENALLGNIWFNTLEQRYYEKAHQTDLGKYLYLKLGTLNNTALESTIIDGFDVYFKIDGKTLRE